MVDLAPIHFILGGLIPAVTSPGPQACGDILAMFVSQHCKASMLQLGLLSDNHVYFVHTGKGQDPINEDLYIITVSGELHGRVCVMIELQLITVATSRL